MSAFVRLTLLLLLAAGMFLYPQEALSAASNGLSLWWKFVLPALLPFFILSELLMGQGIVHLLGVLLEPLMRPLFKLPGKASFVVAMGYTSGFPMGAVLTARLHEQGEISREEGERLLAFTSNPSPGFILGAVASGMLGIPALGALLLGSVYLASLAVGLLFRFYRPTSTPVRMSNRVSLSRAWLEMQSAQRKDGRPLGQVLGDAIRQSITTVLAVGGFMAFFSVIIRLLTIWKVPSLFAVLLQPVLGSFLSQPALEALLKGLLEMTLGCQGVIQALPTLAQQVGALAFLMGWGGFSVFAQVAAFISKTDLRFFAFILGRTLHAALALAFSQIFLHLAKIPVSSIHISMPTNTLEIWQTSVRSSLALFCTITAFLLGVSLIFTKFKKG